MKWELPKMYEMSRHKRVVIDTETNGLNVWGGNRTIGIVVGTYKMNGTVDSRYYPFGHQSGPQYDRADVIDWLRRELRGKELIFHHYNFDALMLWADGLDVRLNDNTLFETQFASALIDPKMSSDLKSLAIKHLPASFLKKDPPVSPDLFWTLPSNELAEYAEGDGVTTGALADRMRTLLKMKGLEKIFKLECEVAPAVVEMEINGLRVDTEKLESWIPQVQEQYDRSLETLKGINPNSAKHLVPAFESRGIIYPYNYVCKECDDEWKGFAPQECPKCGEVVEAKSPHFGKKLLLKIDHPFAKQVVKTKQLKNLLGSFLIPWHKSVKDGILRFNLNQLMDRGPGGYSKGTISGRFSANMLEGGMHPQQIWDPEKQEEEFGFDDFILRELFIPDPDRQFMRIDASQIEYRLFAHYSNSQKLIDTYNNDPNIDYHQMVADIVLQGRMGSGKSGRKKAKNINFGKLYGMGAPRFARESGMSKTEGQSSYKLYDEMFPEAKEIMGTWSRKAGLGDAIETLLGRKFVFGRGDATFVALNRLIQGSAADVMKSAIRLVYREKLMDKLRLTVHDELDGDISSEAQGKRCKEAMEQDLQHLIKVPVIWDLEVGKNWAMRGAA